MAAASAVVALLAVCLTGSPTAHADDPGVAIGIMSMTPSLWTPGATLTITGTVTNNTDADLNEAQVVLWASTTAITNSADLNAALTGDPTAPTGTVVTGAQASTVLVADGNTDLPVGAQANFTVSGQPKLATVGAAYLVGVQVLDSRGHVLARARLTVATSTADGSAENALLVPLTSRPSLVTEGDPTADPPVAAVFRDDHLADELQGNLGKLIGLAGQPGVTALIDPALLDALTQMAAGYDVVADSGATPTPGKGQDAAKAALTSIDALMGTGEAYRLPSGDPDVVALSGLPQAASILTGATLPPSDGALAVLPLAVVADGAVTDQVRALVDGVKPAVVLSDALQTSATQQAGDDGVPWVALTPPSALNNLGGPAPSFDGAANLQPPLNRMALQAIAAAQGAPIVTVAASGDDVAAADNWLSAGGAATGLAQVLAKLQPTPLDWATSAAASTPSSDLVSAVTQTQRQLALLADLGDQPQAAADLGNRVLPGAVASAWNGDWAASLAWLQQATSDLNAQAGGGSVTLHVAGQWMLSSRDNRVPITITNDMGMPVDVRVRFDSENPARLSVPETDVVTVAPKSSATVIVNPLAEANGSVQVKVTLVTVNGATIDTPQDVQVVTTSAGRMGWVIIIGAGLVFVILTSLRVRQVRRQRAKSKMESNETSEPTEGGDTDVQ